jgi:hypothetical protein
LRGPELPETHGDASSLHEPSDGLETCTVRPGKAAHGRVHGPGWPEALHNVGRAPVHHFRDSLHVLCREQRTLIGRSELMREPGLDDKAHAPFDILCPQRDSRDTRIGGRRRLDIHGNKVEQGLPDESLQRTWIAPVGVELDGESERPNPGKEHGQIVMHGGLPASDDDALELTSARAKETKDFLLWNFRRVARGIDKLRIVAIWASEIASTREDDCGNLPREISQ